MYVLPKMDSYFVAKACVARLEVVLLWQGAGEQDQSWSGGGFQGAGENWKGGNVLEPIKVVGCVRVEGGGGRGVAIHSLSSPFPESIASSF